MRLQMTGLLPIVRDVTAIHRSWSLSIDQHARSWQHRWPTFMIPIMRHGSFYVILLTRT